jgi:NADH-quinone oxidoreductase subunit G
MLKQGGEWKTVDWQTALEYVANGLRQIKADHGAQSIGTLASPHSTVEELYLAGALMRGLGSENIDYRLRNAEFPAAQGARWLGTSIASLSSACSACWSWAPTCARTIRCLRSASARPSRKAARSQPSPTVRLDWAMPLAHSAVVPAASWAQALADMAAAIAADKGVEAPAAGNATDAAKAIAQSLLGGERKAILLGNAAAHHANASSLLALANWIGEQTGATVGYLTEAANTVGAQLAGAQPGNGGLNAGQMLANGGALKAVLLLNTEPRFDSAAGAQGPPPWARPRWSSR